MAAPVFQAAGTSAGSNAAISPAWPAHQADDIGLLIVEHGDGQIPALTTPAGFAAFPGSPQDTGAVAGGVGTCVAVWWARATSGAMGTPTVADTGDHQYGRIVTFRGCIASGDPWDVSNADVESLASTSLSFHDLTTTVAECLIVHIAGWGIDNAGPVFSNWVNAALTDLTERVDEGTTGGTGGGFALADGAKATAGATGQTTADKTNSFAAYFTIALKATAGGGGGSSIVRQMLQLHG